MRILRAWFLRLVAVIDGLSIAAVDTRVRHPARNHRCHLSNALGMPGWEVSRSSAAHAELQSRRCQIHGSACVLVAPSHTGPPAPWPFRAVVPAPGHAWNPRSAEMPLQWAVWAVFAARLDTDLGIDQLNGRRFLFAAGPCLSLGDAPLLALP